jgi:hypothetical protein
MLQNYYDPNENRFYLNKLEPNDYQPDMGPTSFVQRPSIEEVMQNNEECVKLSRFQTDEIYDDSAFDQYITDRMNPMYNRQVYGDEAIYETMPHDNVYIPETYNYDNNISIGGYAPEQQNYMYANNYYPNTGMRFPTINTNFGRQPDFVGNPMASKFAFENRFPNANVGMTYYSATNNILLNRKDFNEIRGIETKPNLGRPIYRGLKDVVSDMEDRYKEIQLEKEQMKNPSEPQIEVINEIRLSDDERRHHLRIKEQMDRIDGIQNPQMNSPMMFPNQQPQRPKTIMDLLEKNPWMPPHQQQAIDMHNQSAIMLESVRIGHEYANKGIRKTSAELREEALKNLKKVMEADKPKLFTSPEEAKIKLGQNKTDYVLRAGVNDAYDTSYMTKMLQASRDKQNEVLKKCSCKAEMLRVLGDMYDEQLMMDRSNKLRFDINSQYNRGLYKKLGYMYGHRDQYGNIIEAIERGEDINLDDIEVRIPAPSMATFEQKNRFINSIKADNIPMNILNDINFEAELARKYDGKGTIRIEDTIPPRREG